MDDKPLDFFVYSCSSTVYDCIQVRICTVTCYLNVRTLLFSRFSDILGVTYYCLHILCRSLEPSLKYIFENSCGVILGLFLVQFPAILIAI